jgi:hypothetical protein
MLSSFMQDFSVPKIGLIRSAVSLTYLRIVERPAQRGNTAVLERASLNHCWDGLRCWLKTSWNCWLVVLRTTYIQTNDKFFQHKDGMASG